jgi:hypothetical protein
MLINKDIINIICSFLDGYKRVDIGCKFSVKLKNINIIINELKCNVLSENIGYVIYPYHKTYKEFKLSFGLSTKVIKENEIIYQWVTLTHTDP